jgi:hypothetical protein
VQILPYKRFIIQTQDLPSNIIERLKAKIGSKNAFRENLCSNHAPYAGTILSSGFKLRRIRYNETHFLPHKPFSLPYIRGQFELLPDGIIIHITMRFPHNVIAFVVFCFLACYSLVFLMFVSMEDVFGYVPILEALPFLTTPVAVLFIIRDVFRNQANYIYQELTQIILGESLRSQP